MLEPHCCRLHWYFIVQFVVIVTHHLRGAGTSTRSCRVAWHWAAHWWCSRYALGTAGSSSTARTRALHRARACAPAPLPTPTRLRHRPLVRVSVLLRLRPHPRPLPLPLPRLLPLRANAGAGRGRPRLRTPSHASTLTAFDSVLDILLRLHTVLYNLLVHVQNFVHV